MTFETYAANTTGAFIGDVYPINNTPVQQPVVKLPVGPFVLMDEDGEILAGGESIMLHDLLETHEGGWWPETDVEDAGDEAHLDTIERNNRKILAVLAAAGKLTESGKSYQEEAERQLLRIPERRLELQQEAADNEEIEAIERTSCNGNFDRPSGNILHTRICPIHGSP